MNVNERQDTPRNGASGNTVSDPEVRPRARRRHYTAEYKARILAEAEACRAAGEMGALLRREGLYASLLTKWREQRARGTLEPQRRGPKPQPEAGELERLRQENARLQERLTKAETIIEAQKKVSALWQRSPDPTLDAPP